MKRFYFLGIGGIGMSALARFLKQQGHAVEGYDRTETALTRALAAERIPVSFSWEGFQPAAYDCLVFTPAVGENNPVLLQAREAGLRTLKRAAALGEISARFNTLAVAGTHGKTTTSSMLTTFLRLAGLDASALVGGIMANFGTNYVHGQSPCLVVEADEFDRSFLSLSPAHAIVTSTDPDHLDIYGHPDAVTEAYVQFMHRVRPGGTLLLNESVRPLAIEIPGVSIQYYGRGQVEVRAENIHMRGAQTRFDFVSPTASIDAVELNAPGYHNLDNAIAAMAMAVRLGVDKESLKQAVAGYKGVKRRFEIVLNKPGLVYIDDYAHHPTELEATFASVRRMFPDFRVVAAFQPHLFTRTRDFASGFAAALSQADEIYLMHIYPARELSIPNVTSEMVFQQISNKAKHLINLNQFPEVLRGRLSPNTVVLTLGAGDIDTVVAETAAFLNTMVS